ncbi:hypothetical protein T459_12012 [Capsicum annuum]|uniref:Uncharacterized protein n=1 Tax=Capsicum annuum TaxID=4072 RepID=A0A2G2ZNK2_CAPAN|nr:hypothetical protein T459_12012 [Capsicum annuum]
MPANSKSSNRRPANAHSVPRGAERPANSHSAPRAARRPANAASVGGVRPFTNGVGAQKMKTSTALRGDANLAYTRPRQKKAKETDFGVLFGPSGSVVERSENTDRVLHSPTLISSIPTNIDLGFKSNELRWKG